MKGGPVIQYSSHGKKLNIHADSTKPLWTATRLPLWGLAYLNPPNPLFKGAIRACGLSIAAGPSLLASSGPASDDALLLLFVVAGGFEAFGVLGYLELVDALLDISVHEGREIVH